MANYTKINAFVTLVLLYTLFATSLGKQELVEEPSNITVERGKSVTFPCKVSNRRGVVQWTKGGFGLGTDRDLMSYPRYKMLGENDSGNFSLHISTVLLIDEGEYQCQVGGAEGEEPLRSRIVKLTVWYPPKDDDDQVSIQPSSPLESIAGSDVRLTCRGGLTKPISNITWYKNDEKILSGVETAVESLKGSLLQSLISWVIIPVSKESHNANISCHVTHPALDHAIVRSVIMIVQYPPTVQIFEEFINPKEGDTLKFSCSAEGNPRGFRYNWEMNGEAIGGDENELILTGVTRKENGVSIKCVASNSIGNGEASKTLDIAYEPLFKEEPKDVNGEDGSDVTLECKVDSNPAPEIVWTEGTSNRVIAHGSTYTLKVSKETTGLYRCRATTPGYNEISRSVMVFRRSAPKVFPNQILYGLENSRVELECRIQAIPRPTEVTWYKNNVPIKGESSMKFEQPLNSDTRNGVKARLIINDAQLADFGMYNCSAHNDYGMDWQFVELRRQNTLPMVTTLVSLAGAVVFVVVVAIVVMLFRRAGRRYDDPSIDKQSVRSTEPSSTEDSVLKNDSRTGSGSVFSQSDDALDDWETNDSSSISPKHYNRRHKDSYRFSGDFNEPLFPSKNIQTPDSDYRSYVGYNAEYQPPPPSMSPNFNRNSIYGTNPLNNVDPRYSAAYGNPYLKIPANSRASNYANVDNFDVPSSHSQNNNLNNMNVSSKNIYNPIGQTRNNLRPTNTNNQYIMLAQSDNAVQGTQI